MQWFNKLSNFLQTDGPPQPLPKAVQDYLAKHPGVLVQDPRSNIWPRTVGIITDPKTNTTTEYAVDQNGKLLKRPPTGGPFSVPEPKPQMFRGPSGGVWVFGEQGSHLFR